MIFTFYDACCAEVTAMLVSVTFIVWDNLIHWAVLHKTKWNFTILQQKVSLKGYQASQESPKHPMCNSWHNSKTRWDFKKYSFIYFHWLRCNCLHVSGISPHCNTRKDSCIILSDEECTVLGSGTKKQTIFFVRAQKTSLCTVRSVFGLCHHRNKVINVVVLLN